MPKTIEELEAELNRMREAMAGDNDDNTNDNDDDANEDDDASDDDNNASDEGNNNDEGSDEDNQETLSEEEQKVAALKASLDKLDKKLKEEAKARVAAEKKLKETEISRLREEGKEAEALKAQMEQVEAELAVLREENVTLKRDNVLDGVLSSVEFRNDRSRAMARREIVENLTQGEDGSWMSKDGKTIDDYVSAYVEDESNNFLFKQKTNRGSQSQPGSQPNPGNETPKSILDIPQDQYMKQIEKKLRARGY